MMLEPIISSLDLNLINLILRSIMKRVEELNVNPSIEFSSEANKGLKRPVYWVIARMCNMLYLVQDTPGFKEVVDRISIALQLKKQKYLHSCFIGRRYIPSLNKSEDSDNEVN